MKVVFYHELNQPPGVNMCKKTTKIKQQQKTQDNNIQCNLLNGFSFNIGV